MPVGKAKIENLVRRRRAGGRRWLRRSEQFALPTEPEPQKQQGKFSSVFKIKPDEYGTQFEFGSKGNGWVHLDTTTGRGRTI